MAHIEKITIPSEMTFDRAVKRISTKKMDVSVDEVAKAITKISKAVAVKL